ncbi:MAG: tripartite tricarboxylate transporter substrate binding protein [Roseomonas sp.]|nr:tripartite tricarboxylate transporter substrate binding protein [Roseomonas sp.]MCA3329222.1 tripartite tricarboxylate transporter substrate binding protein [Roseomonas sp.]MCA3332655.1 tripartite tricarboxylate transporter substrate binding protein [Roseomonas sp.]MCA3336353.1 tripartite tricarboxylate transporter substrate binding protein [Roseomonas sp.]MCA3346405.1 tripartite tricarboxylate transporter substrate binding protein [Roseomonas sp.]
MKLARRSALALPALTLLPRPALAAFPDRPVRIIVPFAAGTSSDSQARMIGERMAPMLRQPVIVENRAGAGGVVGADAVAKAAPDGYTLLLGSNGPLTNAPVLQARLPYDPDRDFAAVAMISRSPVTLSVRADSPFRTVADVVAAARAKPGDLSIGSSGQGSATHFLIEQVMAAAGIRLTHVPYRGSSQSVPDLIAGNIPLVMAEISTILPLWQSGRARILAMSSAGRMPIAPDIPTLIEQGLNLTGGSWAGLVTAAGAPPEAVAAQAAAVQAGLREPAYRARQAELGAEIVAEAEQNPAGFAAWLRRERAEIRAIADRAGIKPE